MTAFNQAWVDQQNAKRGAKVPPRPPEDGAERESELHDFILQDCAAQGWLALHGSMAHRTYRTPGEPDFIILLPGGRLLMVECKTKTGKLSTEQLGLARWAERLGHTVHVVRSKEEWREISATK